MLVASAQKKLLEERLKLVSELWDAGIKVQEAASRVVANVGVLGRLIEVHMVPLPLLLRWS